MFETIIEMFNFPFIVRAVIVGTLASICAALLGVSLVLKRYSMIGIGLSNVGFGSLVLTSLIVPAIINIWPQQIQEQTDEIRFDGFLNAAVPMVNELLTIAIPMVMVIAAAFLLLRLSENSKIRGDAAVAIVSTISLAIGGLIMSRTTGANADVCNFLFGSMFTTTWTDVYLSIVLSAVVLILFVLFYNKLFAITFDETFAKTSGVKTGLYNALIALLTALTIVLGMRTMGSMLITSLIIFPALSSMRLFKKFKSVTICSAVISIFCFFIGVYVSFEYDIRGGASIVLVNIIVFALFWLAAILCNSTLLNRFRK